jgi:PAS domain S-box-containing protein
MRFLVARRDDVMNAQCDADDGTMAQYGALLEHLTQGFLVYQESVIRFVNPATVRIFGYTYANELQGLDPRVLMAPAEHRRLAGYLLSASVSSQPVEWQGRCRDGTLIWVESLVSAISWQEQPAVLITFLDITLRKHLEVQLRQVQKMAALGTLAGGIAHDFNNILAAILGFTELSLFEVPYGSRASHNMHAVLTAGKRARDLVQQILAFSRQHVLTQHPVQLHAVIQELMTWLRATLPSTIDIRQQVDPRTRLVLADPTQIQQILLNLCANAEYAMRESGGILSIRLENVEIQEDFIAAHPELQPGSHVRLSVQDTGQGIPPELFARIFDPFFTTKMVGEGTGMGLAVVRDIVASHRGAIVVHSTPRGGTTFEIYFPSLNTPLHEDVVVEEPVPRGHECILFVDDEPALACLGRESLVQLGYEVICYTSSVDALASFHLTPQRFDLVITDQTMPHVAGEALSRQLRVLRPDIPIILCTGFSHTMSMEKAHALGIQAFLMKPYLSRDLAYTVRQVLDQRMPPLPALDPSDTTRS